MVDATDFASVESGITASDFNSGATVKFYGANHGGSAATTSGTVSKTASLIRSGMFRITLKGTENNYDEMTLRVNKTGCAEQILQWRNWDNDDSDLMSALTVIQSMASDAASAAAQANSRVLLNQSRISDVASYLVALSAQVSDTYSAVVNDVYSDLIGTTASTLSDIYSLLSDLNSNILSRVPKEIASKSLLSDVNSDLASKIGAITATVSASDISDIASAVKAIMASDISDIHSAATAAASRALLNQSRISDVASYLVAMSDALSDAHSDLASKIGGITASVGASDISDIASAVRAILISDLSDIHSAATAGASRALINQSRISDVQSFLSDFQSDLLSHLDATGVGLNASTMSDLRSAIAATELDASDLSDIASAVRTIVSSDLSDIISAVAVANSRVLLNQSRISDLQSFMSDLQSDLLSHLDTTGVQLNASTLSDIRSAITANGMLAAGADPTGVIGVTASYGAKLDWLAAMSRNKLTQTSTSAVLFNDGGTAVASATCSDDGTTFTRDEWH